MMMMITMRIYLKMKKNVTIILLLIMLCVAYNSDDEIK